jgi:hypothetical protein
MESSLVSSIKKLVNPISKCGVGIAELGKSRELGMPNLDDIIWAAMTFIDLNYNASFAVTV